MKKILALMLAAALALSLVACGGGGGTGDNKTLTKEEMIESAGLLRIDKIDSDTKDNIVNAKEKYIGNCYETSGIVLNIHEDGCILGTSYGIGSRIKVLLSEEEIKNLSINDLITVVGYINEIEQGQTINLENAHFVDSVLEEFSGVVRSDIAGLYNGIPLKDMYIEVQLFTSSKQKIILENTDEFDIESGDTVTISGTGILQSDGDSNRMQKDDENFIIYLSSDMEINIEKK